MESPENKLSHSLALLLLSEERNYLTDYNPLVKSSHSGCIHGISYVWWNFLDLGIEIYYKY